MSDVPYETRIVRKVLGLKFEPSTDPTKPTILILVGETDTGPLDLRITQSAAKELMGVLSTHPLVGGCP
jgi:hypothetical protein